MDAFKYWAFISYSSRDRAWGEWLRRAMESYRVPPALVGKPTPRGEAVPARLFPVFRDRDELPTDADLSEAINTALARSRYLIVVCSPHSAQSRWVNKEIMEFKRLGRENRVLAVILEGEPNASDGGPGTNAARECFPPALRFKVGPAGTLTAEHTEPIAADVREEGDGRANALLKLLAGVLGVNYDDLKRRDEAYQRQRLRRMQLAAGGFAALAFFASVAAWLAWRGQRQVGERFRTETLVQAQSQRVLEQGQAALAQEEVHSRAAAALVTRSGEARTAAQKLLAAAQRELGKQQRRLAEATDGARTLAAANDELTETLLTLQAHGPAFDRSFQSGLRATLTGPAAAAKRTLLTALEDARARTEKNPLIAVETGEEALGELDQRRTRAEQVLTRLEQAPAALEKLGRGLLAFRRDTIHAANAELEAQSTSLAEIQQGWAARRAELNASERLWAVREPALQAAVDDWQQACQRWRRAEQGWQDYLRGFAGRLADQSALERKLQHVTSVAFDDDVVTGALVKPDYAATVSADTPTGTVGLNPVLLNKNRIVPADLQAGITAARQAGVQLEEMTYPAALWLDQLAGATDAQTRLETRGGTLLGQIKAGANELAGLHQTEMEDFSTALAGFDAINGEAGNLTALIGQSTARLQTAALELEVLVRALPPATGRHPGG